LEINIVFGSRETPIGFSIMAPWALTAVIWQDD
jgi:hypothetical protein